MMHEVAMNLKLPTSTNATQQFIDFIYLTQVTRSVFKLIKPLLVCYMSILTAFYILYHFCYLYFICKYYDIAKV